MATGSTISELIAVATNRKLKAYDQIRGNNYTSKFLLTGYMGHIYDAVPTDMATTSWSTVEGTMRVLYSYCICSSYYVIVASVYLIGSGSGSGFKVPA